MLPNILWKLLIFSTVLKITTSSLLRSEKDFATMKCIPGEQFSYKTIYGHVKILVCAGKENGVPQWQFTDGSPTLGEVFNPARDCSDIVDHLPEANDGFYWITNQKNKYKIWCSLYIDGGGFMLVGMKDSPKSWTVPSNSTPVDPQGPPHWSSVLGDFEILDFAIQVSSNNSFQGTKEHWLYHLNKKRQLGNLFTNDNGCTADDPGISDVMYIKDVRDGSITTTNFQCSIFGPHTHPNLGWARMNQCFRQNCKNGYGVIPGPFPFQYAQYGSFSYSAVSSSSGKGSNSTAFVGCDNGKCCACFGPKGGRQNYCGPKCTAINGGTVMKKAYVWFWVRTRIPERVWKKCMEFTKKNFAGKVETYFINPRTGTVHKGSCSRQFKTFLNEGTLTISDKESFKKVPNIPGLLSFREDNKELYVNQGSKWQALSSEDEVQLLQRKIHVQENKIQTQGNKLQTQGNKIQTQGNKIQTQGNKIQIQENKIQTQENKIQAQGNKIQAQGNKIQTQGSMIKKLQKDYKDIANRIDTLHTPSTCSLLRKTRPSTTSGKYNLNPEGLISSPLVQVYCDMTSKNGVGVTVIGHDSESKTNVKGYNAPGSYKRKINYNLPMKEVIAIIKQSQSCEQFIKYDCYHSLLLHNSHGWWVSRQGSQMNYWGGAAINSGKCACGMTNSCAGGSTCNCDKNDATWREDSGYLTDKNTLPVTELRFGDTGDIWVGNGGQEQGYHTLGKLRCWG